MYTDLLCKKFTLDVRPSIFDTSSMRCLLIKIDKNRNFDKLKCPRVTAGINAKNSGTQNKLSCGTHLKQICMLGIHIKSRKCSIAFG